VLKLPLPEEGSSAPRSFLRDEHGNTMAEFAMVAAVFLTLFLGIVEFGFHAWDRNSVTADAREGARYAIVHGSTSLLAADSAAVANYVKSRTTLDTTIRVTTIWTPDNHPGSHVQVIVKHPIPRRGPFIPAMVDSAASEMIILF
jgi:Flp pilus assembly protein TadG